MHKEVLTFVKNILATLPPRKGVVDFGSRDVTNVSVRPLFEDAKVFIGVDIRAGKDVDVVADAAKFKTDKRIDTVVSTSTLVHTKNMDAILANAYKVLSEDGVAIISTVCAPWHPHGMDGGNVGDEFYRDVPADLLQKSLVEAGFASVKVEQTDAGDVFAIAWKAKRAK